MSSGQSRFRYFLDPVFLGAFCLYLLNHWFFKPWGRGHTTLFDSYFNDLICIPFWLPPWLRVYRLIGVRDHDRPPTRFELITHVIVWSLFFEWIGPAIKGPFAWTVSDPWDVVAYVAGAAIASAVWGTWKTDPGRRTVEAISNAG